jgi:hypothetical protein
MARTRLTAITALAVALSLAQQQTVRSQVVVVEPAVATPVQRDAICVVYPLAELGHDPNLAKWLAETIPTVIQPGSWDQAAGTKITYYGPAKVLVVYHSPAVHTQVKAFLADMKNAARDEKGTIHLRKPPVVQADYNEAAPTRGPQTAGVGYPVPSPQTPPKHLFHLIIRYEGDGLSDDMVAGLVKQISDGGADKGEVDGKKAEPAKGPTLGQLLHFIVRYEGEGIIDANVVALLKELYGANAAKGWVCPPPSVENLPVSGSYSSRPANGFAPSTFGTTPIGTTPPVPVTQPGANPAQDTRGTPAPAASPSSGVPPKSSSPTPSLPTTPSAP